MPQQWRERKVYHHGLTMDTIKSEDISYNVDAGTRDASITLRCLNDYGVIIEYEISGELFREIEMKIYNTSYKVHVGDRDEKKTI
tara:strand:- start:6715 stop:6969 length:255 start_codon:yes stop_codon:yes gene_type:complete